ncbi:hypothetical protein FM105_03015 [Brevibacterium yomogidense]|uniref:Uncharacterized protein n=1 Tax=Brevibacterium yomogidense TaxID=946573 RepID=A0A1X6X1G8_9MICO|nr:hypothetical protein FM105_03015 [Brevibacterium yomogidense]
MTDGRQIEYTLDGERRLLQKTDRLQRVLKERKVKWKRYRATHVVDTHRTTEAPRSRIVGPRWSAFG